VGTRRNRYAGDSNHCGDLAQGGDLIMNVNLISVAIFAIAATTVIVATIASAMSATARKHMERPITRAIPAVVSTRMRRQATRTAGIRLIAPEHLPALARAQIFRLQTSHLASTAPRRRQARCK
jgi:hypothetical protein